MVEEGNMVYVPRLQKVDSRVIHLEEENQKNIERIEKEAIKHSSLLYRFIYEPVKTGVAIYQIIKANKVCCRLRYCSVDGTSDKMVEQWGEEVNVGTKYVLRRLKALDLAVDGKIREIKIPEKPSKEVSELAYEIGNKSLYIKARDDGGYDYYVFNKSFSVLDDGIYDDEQLDIWGAAKILLDEALQTKGATPVIINPEKLSEAAGNLNAVSSNEFDAAIMLRLTMGNIGDEVALKNICEAQSERFEELTDDEKEFLIDTNSFYYSEEEYCLLHNETPERFRDLVSEGYIVKTTDGYVFINCV